MKPRPFSGMAQALILAEKGITVYDEEVVYASKLKIAKLVDKTLVKGKPVYRINAEGKKVLKLLKKDMTIQLTLKRW